MARPIKDGVDYFPMDTDFYNDDKVRLLRAEFGAKGMYVLNFLLCEVYGKNGYFINWDKNRCFLVSDGAGCGCSPEYISEFISGCLRCSFFDERVFNAFGVLTSAGIQRRYIRMFNSRDEIRIIEEYWLLDIKSKNDVPAGVLNKLTFKKVNCTENPDKTTENPDKTTENPQKEKESKKKTEGTNVPNSKKASASGPKVVVPEPIAEAFNEFVKMRRTIKKPLTTDGAVKRALMKLESLAPGDYQKQIAIINQSIDHCWVGLFELKTDKGGVGDVGRNQQSSFESFRPSRT
ncbi:MAG: DUF4373 domain-containing protein [Eubacterium sp.]|nr:DUF4373 domain-containing protein [Eubacterium sp.]